MLKEYIEEIRKKTKVERIVLLSKEYLVKFYVSCGFTVAGPSHVQHGKEQWIELYLSLV
jgi:predicted GNAT family N-acyltransferase